MKAGEIKRICINGSKAYYKYLSNKRNGGVDEIQVTKIEKVDNTSYKLKITKKLFDPDTVSFRYNGNSIQTFTSEDVKIKVYDNDKKIIVVNVSPKVAPLISPLKANEWKVVVDLKFLVQRVIDWYELNGNNLKFKPGPSKNKLEFDESVIMPEKGTPSDEQKNAIQTIFDYNFSYIWGAPGTGKTRMVLSYALLTYIKKNKRVFVLAPTNVALEQIFRGIIEMTDAAGIKRKKLLRLGFPSQSFAKDFGEVCEIQGIEKELKRINTQIKIISSILGIDTEETKKKKKLLNELTKLKEHQDQKFIKTKERGDVFRKINEQSSSLEVNQKKLRLIEKEREVIFKKKNSLLGKFLGLLSERAKYDKELENLSIAEKKLEESSWEIKASISQYQSDLRTLANEITKIEEKIKTLTAHIKGSSFLNKTPLNNIDRTIENLQKSLDEQSEEIQISDALKIEYESLSKVELQNQLEKYEAERKKLLQYSLEERLENVNVIGATLDTYLYRFKEKPLKADHFFIDEAGYASTIKALTVFRSEKPITLLGDHKQLPPVCELSKRDIKKFEEYQDVFLWDQSAIYLEEIWSIDEKNILLQNYLNAQSPSFRNLKKTSLTQTYRFGPNLAKTLGEYVYHEDGFNSNKENNTEVIICKVSNPENLRKGKRLNEAEAFCIRSYINKYHPQDSNLAVLSPYRDQIKRLKELLPKIKEEDRILTVHKSQGREWDTVIYSVCDYGNGRTPWFTDTMSDISNGLNNVNTAVSRAKKRLVVFLSHEDWKEQRDQLIYGLIKSATKVISYNTESLKSVDSKTKPSRKQNTSNSASSSKGPIRGKDYVPTKPDEQWESKTLYWSKKPLPGYKYSPKKKAYWKKK
jgi:hypothetical protein